MNKYNLICAALLTAGLWSCKPVEDKKSDAPLIGKKNLELKSDVMTPEVLWSFGRVSEPEVSPDNKTILYGVTYYDVEQNKGNRELFA